MIEAILGAGILVVLIVVVLSVLLYILPAIIAVKRDHRSKGGIIALNILLGWSFIGWVAALIWSFSDSGQSSPTINIKNVSTGKVTEGRTPGSTPPRASGSPPRE